MAPRKPTQEELKKSTTSKATVAGHQGHWVPFSEHLVSNEAWSGKKVPGDAWRVLWWLTDRMTGNVKFEGDPKIYGVVAGGNTISFKDIASDLNCSWSSIRRSMNWLVNHTLVARGRGGKGQEYCYQVINSIRQFDLQAVAGSSGMDNNGTEETKGVQPDGTIRKNGKTYTDKGNFVLRCDRCNIQFANEAAMEDHFDNNKHSEHETKGSHQCSTCDCWNGVETFGQCPCYCHLKVTQELRDRSERMMQSYMLDGSDPDPDLGVNHAKNER